MSFLGNLSLKEPRITTPKVAIITIYCETQLGKETKVNGPKSYQIHLTVHKTIINFHLASNFTPEKRCCPSCSQAGRFRSICAISGGQEVGEVQAEAEDVAIVTPLPLNGTFHQIGQQRLALKRSLVQKWESL